MDKRSPEEIRKSIKSLVEEAESVSVENKENDNTVPKPESKLDNVSIDLEDKYKKNLIKKTCISHMQIYISL